MKCPKCNLFMERKAGSLKDAAIGAGIGVVLLGPIGLAGALFGLGEQYRCPKCGYTKKTGQTANAHSQIGKTLTQEGVNQFKAGYNSAKNNDD